MTKNEAIWFNNNGFKILSLNFVLVYTSTILISPWTTFKQQTILPLKHLNFITDFLDSFVIFDYRKALLMHQWGLMDIWLNFEDE